MDKKEENIVEWFSVFYNKLETNIEVSYCGRVRRVEVMWMKRNSKFEEIDLEKLKLSDKGYRQVCIQIKGLKGRTVRVHKLVASAFSGYEFNGMSTVVDHIDGNILNNNRNNLRVISNRENTSREKTIKSGLPVGVYQHKKSKKYQAHININGKVTYIGIFSTPKEASIAY